MKISKYILTSLLGFALCFACSKEDYIIEYQDDYPSILVDNWVAFEFRGGKIEGAEAGEPYDLVTSLDPNVPNGLIIDKLYDSDVRIRATYSDTAFSADMAEVLEEVSTNTYDIDFVTVDGYITKNPVLINTLHQLAQSYYENMQFDRSYIEDLIFMRAGFYDAYEAKVDTILLIGYRKTGFEEVNLD